MIYIFTDFTTDDVKRTGFHVLPWRFLGSVLAIALPVVNLAAASNASLLGNLVSDPTAIVVCTFIQPDSNSTPMIIVLS
jgi:hypothetical protein